MAQEGEDIRSEIYDQRQLGYAVLKQVLKTEEVQGLLDHDHRLRVAAKAPNKEDKKTCEELAVQILAIHVKQVPGFLSSAEGR